MQPSPPITVRTLSPLPLALRAWTGLTPAGFDVLLGEVSAAHREGERRRHARQPAPGAGRPFKLSLADRLLLTLVHARHRPVPGASEYWFGLSGTSVWRAQRNVTPLLTAVGRSDLFARPPDAVRLSEVRAALAEMPPLATWCEYFWWGDGPDRVCPHPPGDDPLVQRLARFGLRCPECSGGPGLPDGR